MRLLFLFKHSTSLWYTAIVMRCWHPKVLVQWWQRGSPPPTPLLTLSFLLFPCWLSTKQKKREKREREKEKLGGSCCALVTLPDHLLHWNVIKKFFTLQFFYWAFYFYYHHYYYGTFLAASYTHVQLARSLACSHRRGVLLVPTLRDPRPELRPPGSIKAHCGTGTWSYLQGSFATRWGPGLGWRWRINWAWLRPGWNSGQGASTH